MKGLLLLMMTPMVSLAAIPADAVRTQSVHEICTVKTSTVRNVSAKVKRQVYQRDGVPGGNHTGICAGPEGCEVDHRVSLELGGSNSINNLMIQPYQGSCNAHQKDKLENKFHRLICAGEMQPRQAQELIYSDWKGAYKTYVDSAGCD